MTETALCANLLTRPTAEDWLAHRLQQLGHTVDPGTAPLKDRLRRAITTQGIGMLILGRAPGGKPETFAEAWERIYTEPFHVKQPSNRRSHNDRS